MPLPLRQSGHELADHAETLDHRWHEVLEEERVPARRLQPNPVWLRYSDANGSVTDRVVNVGAVRSYHDRIYLVGVCGLRQDYRCFRVDRIATLANPATGQVIDKATWLLGAYAPDAMSSRSTPVQPTAAPPKPQAVAPPPQRTHWALRAIFWTVAFIVVMSVISKLLKNGPAGPDAQPAPYHPTASDACYMAQKFVEDQLKAPSTAKFQSCLEARAKEETDGTWTVLVVVDAQNGFGAMLRNNYLVEGLRYTGRSANGDYNWKREKAIVDLGR